MEVLFHIGSPKAGSSTLQDMLALNAPELADQGILAWQPEWRTSDPARALANLLLPIERAHFSSRAESIVWSRDCWKDLAAQVGKRRPRLTVLSSETMMELQTPRKLIEALRQIFDRVTILAYIRDPADHYRSGLDQAIRGGARMAELPLPVSFFYPDPAILGRYPVLPGVDGFILRNFDRANLAKGDLIADFAACIARLTGQAPDLPARPAATNESLPAAATLWLLSANETFARFTSQNDRDILKRRRAVISGLRNSAELRDLPALRLDDPEIAGWARQGAASLISFCNAHFAATGQTTLTAPPPPADLPPPEAMRARLHRWLNGQATPEAIARVVQVVTARY